MGGVEQHHGMSTEEFLAHFEAGSLGDQQDRRTAMAADGATPAWRCNPAPARATCGALSSGAKGRMATCAVFLKERLERRPSG